MDNSRSLSTSPLAATYSSNLAVVAHQQPALGANTNTANNQFQVVKERFKRESKRWGEQAAPMYFLLRSGFCASVTLPKTPFVQLLRNVAFPEPAMLETLTTHADVDISTFTPPLPEGWTPLPREYIVHLETLAKVFCTLVEYGTQHAGEPSAGRRRQPRLEINSVVKHIREYLSLHQVEIVGREAHVKARLLTHHQRQSSTTWELNCGQSKRPPHEFRNYSPKWRRRAVGPPPCLSWSAEPHCGRQY